MPTNQARQSTRTLCVVLVLLIVPACGDSTGPDAENPTPGIVSISPTEFLEGDAGGVLTITGSDFVTSSRVLLDGMARSTSYVSRSEIRADVTASDLSAPDTIQVTVTNPAPGGGISNAVSLVVRVRVNPTPVPSSVEPTFALAGGGAPPIVVTGAGFVGTSVVWLDNHVLPTSFVSEGRLSATIPDSALSIAKARTIYVVNPSPGGGVSAGLPFEVRSPVPSITSLSPTATEAGQTGLVLGISGSGFLENSEVLVDGVPRTVHFVSGNNLGVDLLATDLRSPGQLSISVRNPAPGGGTSNTETLDLVNPVPTLAALPSRGATAGGTGFSLVVAGSGFTTTSIVRLDGADLTTQYLGPTRLSADVTAGDVAAPGDLVFTVHNPAPGGGTTAGRTMTVRTIPTDALTSQETVSLIGRDVVWVDGTARLYVSVASTDAAHGNTIARVDPVGASVEESVFMGSEPARLGLSDDGADIYVGLNGAAAVRRLQVASFSPGLQWPLPADEAAGDIEVLPGSNTSVVVSRHRLGWSPPLRGVTVYDDGVPRPTSSPGHTGGARLAITDAADEIYGFNNAHTGFEFFTIGVEADGLRHTSQTRGLISGFYTDIEAAGGRIYGTDGSIVDPVLLQKLGSIGSGTAVAVDVDLGRAFVLEASSIGVFDLNNFQRLGTIPASGWALAHPANLIHRMVRWGADGLAFLDTDELFLVRSPIIGN